MGISIPISLPGLPVGGLPGLDFSSGPAVSDAKGGMAETSIFSPFTFDNSNWQVQVKSSGSQSATSASGATAPGMPPSGGGLPMNLILIGAAAWFLLK
jgi:hypothetical protein